MIFTSAFVKKIYEQMVAFIQSKSLKLNQNKILKVVNSMKADFLFASLNVNIFIQKKAPKNTFYGWWFKNKGH